MAGLQSIAAFIFVFGLLVVFHEFGHFIAAKLSRVRVDEFAVGFGPPVLRRRVGETVYALRLIPLGGFVRLAGMDALDREEPRSAEAEPGQGFDFRDRPVWARMAIYAAGPAMNILLAIVLFALIYSGLSVQITGVLPGSPAEEAGLQPGDRLVSIDGEPVVTSETVIRAVRAAGERPVELTVSRRGGRIDMAVTPRWDPDRGNLMLGVELMMGLGPPRQGAGISLAAGWRQTWGTVAELGRLIGRMIAGKEEPELAGPIGIFQITGSAAEGGLLVLLSITAALSVHLALFNLLPIPVLDGGALLFLAIEAVRGRPLSPEHRGLAQMIGLSLLLMLLVYATLQDLRRLAPVPSESSGLGGGDVAVAYVRDVVADPERRSR